MTTSPPPQTENTSAVSVWDERFAELRAFVEKHGHFCVPKYQAEYLRLHAWMKEQRYLRRKGRLNPRREQKLEEFGLPWNPPAVSVTQKRITDRRWQDRYEELLAFKKQHGHTRVTTQAGPHLKLGEWLSQQRINHRKGSLPQERVLLLEEAGVEWNPFTDPWLSNTQTLERLAQLRQFHEQHGHANVPKTSPSHPGLGNWAASVRMARKRGRLSEPFIRELDALNFRWISDKEPDIQITPEDTASWQARHAEVAELHRTHGYLSIPEISKLNPSLADWLIMQRQLLRLGRLHGYRTWQLESLGYYWS